MKYNHPEAFCLMWYACSTEGCGHRERIYNSRDGVTPFSLGCPSCGKATLSHTQFNRDERHTDYVPFNGQRVWIGMSIKRAEEIAAASARRVFDQTGQNVTRKQLQSLIKDIYKGGEEPDLMIFGYKKGRQQ